MNRWIPMSSLIALLAACGGSGGASVNAAVAKSFTYAAPQAPSTSEQGIATAAQGQLSATADFSAAPNADKATALVVFAEAIVAAALNGPAVPMPHPSAVGFSRALTQADFSGCTTKTATSVTFKGCATQQGGLTSTLSGTVSVAADVVTWDVTGGVSGTSTNGITVNVNLHEAGNSSVTATKISGKALSESGGTVSGQGKSFSFGLATAVLMDLTYQSSPTSCVTAGTLEAKRVWTQKPSGVSGVPNDAAVKLTWTGCNAFQVAHGT